jgi:RNA polymerase sigma-70 factor, ECF subfamily
MNRGDVETDRRRRFGDLCESLRPDLLRFAFWLGRDRQLAEDVVQETIVRREFARSFERKRLPLADLDELVAAEADVLAAEDDEQLAAMRAALFRLDDEYREPLVLQVMMGYSTKEIAAMMGLQQGAVLTRLFRARARLRQELGLAAEPAT